MQRRDDPGASTTEFLPAARSTRAELTQEIAFAASSPIVDALLQSHGTAMGILDQHRQLVALNAAYLQLLGVSDPGQVLGLRPGEAIDCSYVEKAPSGCGTGQACASCGMALAVMVAGHEGRPEQRDCFIHVERPGKKIDHAFSVRVAPLEIERQRWLLVTIDDVSAARRQAAIERAFLHDLGNVVTGLQGASQLLGGGDPQEDAALIADIRTLAAQLAREVQVHRALCNPNPQPFRVALQRVTFSTVAAVLQAALQHHPAAQDRTVAFELPEAGPVLMSDVTLLERVLLNMVLNALEATQASGRVRLVVEQRADGTAFRVWNAGVIAAAVMPRIFQRYFTTKEGSGRGHGTYAMKLFGEEYLGGRVSFTSTHDAGTWFELLLPPAATLRI